VITSVHNPRVKAAARLRDARQRQKQGRIVIDGSRELLRALQAHVEVVEVFVCEKYCRSNDCRELLEALAQLATASSEQPVAHGIEVLQVSCAVFEKLAFGARAEGVVGVARTPRMSLAHVDESLRSKIRRGEDSYVRLGEPRPRELIAVLEGVEKPGNLGAVLRSADAAGVSALIVADGGTDLYNPNAIRASLGTVFTVPVCTASSHEALAWLQANNLAIYAARVDAELEYTAADFTQPCAIVLGSEASGLTERWAAAEPGTSPRATGSASAITPIKLPMRGVADSLNVSATAAVLFYEALRQRVVANKK
jgi:TrmH family RNA methyltransferase